jgi:hypothetical protein
VKTSETYVDVDESQKDKPETRPVVLVDSHEKILNVLRKNGWRIIGAKNRVGIKVETSVKSGVGSEVGIIIEEFT